MYQAESLIGYRISKVFREIWIVSESDSLWIIMLFPVPVPVLVLVPEGNAGVGPRCFGPEICRLSVFLPPLPHKPTVHEIAIIVLLRSSSP